MTVSWDADERAAPRTAELTFTSGALWGQRRKFRMNGSYNHARRTGVTKRLNASVALVVASLVPFPFDGFGMEHPRPHAERRNRLSNPAARKSIHNSNLCALVWRRTLGTRRTGNHNWRNCRIQNVMECSSCWLLVGPMIFAYGIKPRAICPGIM